MPRARGRGARLNKTWTGITFNKTTLTVTQQSLGGVTIPEGGSDFTVLRTIGSILAVAVPNATADDDILALGVIVVQNAAAQVGGASLPGPLNDLGADWLWWEAIPLQSVAATAATENSRNLIHRVAIHSKGMRKVHADQNVLLMAELSTGEMGAVTVNGGIRFLLGS